MKLIVGLGNPGREYENTPHNAGFLVLDKLTKRLGLDWQPKFASFMSLITRPPVVLAILLKPQLFMNRGGQAVAEAARYYQIKPADIWVVHDELDLPLGTVKITFNKSSAGHKGVLSVINALKTQAFYRLRLGVMPEQKPADPDYYLTAVPLMAGHKKLLAPAIERAETALGQLIRGRRVEKILSWANQK